MKFHGEFGAGAGRQWITIGQARPGNRDHDALMLLSLIASEA